MPDISATEAARNFADLLDGIEHRGEQYTIVRRGRPVAHLEPVRHGHGSEVKSLLRRHWPDRDWARDLAETRSLLEIEQR